MFPIAYAENRSILCSEAICFYLVDEYTPSTLAGWSVTPEN